MNIVEPTEPKVPLVRLSEVNFNQPFRAPLKCDCTDCEDGYGYYVKCGPNPGFLRVMRSAGNEKFIGNRMGDDILIFNIRENGLGLMKASDLVEPVDVTVNVERKSV